MMVRGTVRGNRERGTENRGTGNRELVAGRSCWSLVAAVIPSGAAKRRSRGIETVLGRGPSVGTRAIPRLRPALGMTKALAAAFRS